jgi:hypothetical protein
MVWVSYWKMTKDGVGIGGVEMRVRPPCRRCGGPLLKVNGVYLLPGGLLTCGPCLTPAEIATFPEGFVAHEEQTRAWIQGSHR